MLPVKECHNAQEVRDLYREVHKRIYARTVPPPPPPATRASVPPLSAAHIDAIKWIVARYYGVPPTLMSAPYKGKRVIWPRFVAIHFCHVLTGATTVQIGQAFGRDHSTIVSALQRVDRRLHNRQFVAIMDRVKAKIADHFATNGDT